MNNLSNCIFSAKSMISTSQPLIDEEFEFEFEEEEDVNMAEVKVERK